jgi:thiamine-monophosphate kinase
MTRLPPAQLALGPGTEFDWIREVIRLLGEQAVGLGDDCAFIHEGDEFVALSTDVSVEQVHFRLDWLSLDEIGWRATASALSDLAAKGSEPIGVLSAVTIPPGAGKSELLQVMSGVGAAAQFAHALVLGGDLSSGPAWSIAVTVVGRTRAPVTRAGAQPGDRLWVTGSLGGARAALETWRRNEQPPSEARARFAHPEPRIAAGRWLARHGAHAMLDLSDGLAGDASHLAAASSVALEIDLGRLPLASDVIAVATRSGSTPAQFAAEGGEDFELLVALPPRFDAAESFLRECGIPLTRVGVAKEGSGVRFLLESRPVVLRGFNHFG